MQVLAHPSSYAHHNRHINNGAASGGEWTPERFIDAKEDLLLIGPPGTGKSHVAKALALLAVQRGYKVLYREAHQLVEGDSSAFTPVSRLPPPVSCLPPPVSCLLSPVRLPRLPAAGKLPGSLPAMTYGTTHTAIVALGGNALAPTGAESTIAAQFRHTRASLIPIVDLALEGWGICVVHGNGPQVGDALLRNELASDQAAPLPLGVLVAATAGWIGYMIQQSLENALRAARSDRAVATVITQVEVDPADPALRAPSKFIGHEVAPERVGRLRAAGECVEADGRGRLRRVVASPRPQAIHELATIRRLLARDTIVVCCGGGGVPVYKDAALGLEGVDAVIDKDLAAAVLARELHAELLLILTDVDAVYADWGTPAQRPLTRLGAAEAEALDARGAFGEGSMAPKVRAAIDFARRSGGRAIITELSRGRDAVRGDAGTTITAESA